MIAYLEALIAFADCKSMTRAAAKLRLTQSAVSKRITALEQELGKPVVERLGRHSVLTPYGVHVLDRARPLLAELKGALLQERVETRGRITLAVSHAILTSWGAGVLAAIARQHPSFDLHIGAFEGRVALENVRSGEYAVALCRGAAETASELRAEYLLDEPMVIVPSGLKPFSFPRSGTLEVMSVEPNTETFGFLDRRGKRAAKKWGFSLAISNTYQTAAAVTQLARAGFGHGLVPIGVPRSFGIAEKHLARFPRGGLSVPVSLVGRPTTLALPHIQTLLSALHGAVPSFTEKGV